MSIIQDIRNDIYSRFEINLQPEAIVVNRRGMEMLCHEAWETEMQKNETSILSQVMKVVQIFGLPVYLAPMEPCFYIACSPIDDYVHFKEAGVPPSPQE